MDLFVSYDPEFTGTSLVVCAHLTGGQPHAPRRDHPLPPPNVWHLQFGNTFRLHGLYWRTGELASEVASLRSEHFI